MRLLAAFSSIVASLCISEDWERLHRIALYSTFVDAAAQTEVTFVAPVGSPRILDDPILAVGCVAPITNQGHSVVHLHEGVELA